MGTLFSFGNERFRPQGCIPGIWSSLVSGTWHVKMGLTELRDSHCVSVVLIKAFSVLLLQVCLLAIFLSYKRFFPRSKYDATALLYGVCLDHEGELSNILNGGFLTDHSEPQGLVFDMPLCMLALWQGLSAWIDCKISGSTK